MAGKVVLTMHPDSDSKSIWLTVSHQPVWVMKVDQVVHYHLEKFRMFEQLNFKEQLCVLLY